jgi:hypothetical protein
MEPATILLRPTMVAKVIRAARRARRAQSATPAAPPRPAPPTGVDDAAGPPADGDRSPSPTGG